MKHYHLVSERSGAVVQEFTDFRKAKILQVRAAVRGVHYRIDYIELGKNATHNPPRTYPDCLEPCKLCVDARWLG